MVGLHEMQKGVHHVEEDPDGSRFVVGDGLVESRGHVAEIQLSRGRRGRSPGLLLALLLLMLSFYMIVAHWFACVW